MLFLIFPPYATDLPPYNTHYLVILNLKPRKNLGKKLGPQTSPKPGLETWARGGLTIH